jgi:sodium/bile acid cotransporter 7
MLQSLRQHWFLLALAIAIGVSLVWTDEVNSFAKHVPPRVAIGLVLALNAWTLESRRLWESLRRPWYALTAMAVTYGLIPLLGWATSSWLHTADYAIGLLITTSVPCTLAAATVWTRMAGGNEATALLVTLATTCTSWLFTTAWLALTTGREVELDQWSLMRDLAVYLIIPVAVGQAARYPERLRAFATRHRPALSVSAQLLILTIVLQALAMAATRLRADAAPRDGLDVALALVLSSGLHLLGMSVGYGAGAALRFPRGERIAIAIAGSQKTLPIGLLLINTFFTDFPLAVVPLLFYHVGQLILDSFIASLFWKPTPASVKGRDGRREDWKGGGTPA